ncbi:uncharacterized protein LOC117239819 isoform X2 [Bombus vosnesenskii]|uniref:Uncharacterized protein LOC117239819 isoform X2 n=1 Tax=Bombus vosnesenskii TaxID=207650 RepID=A0A6J3L8A9_9HYME|nr:uncharacterized protein LOC117239819 isoform X2 [Bombus vosnesenskii]XP_033361543.1 uncharacterized protein LOC117239819 isoform X3 [Bombus vosnesenskii]XP_033361544.1 uncharacterized protein LOC117239819 isoform X2 [Bombus vosnesenskii]
MSNCSRGYHYLQYSTSSVVPYTTVLRCLLKSFLWFYNSNPSSLSPLLGTVTWCAFGIFWFFVTCLTLIKTTSTYPRIFLVAALTVSVVSGSVFPGCRRLCSTDMDT